MITVEQEGIIKNLIESLPVQVIESEIDILSKESQQMLNIYNSVYPSKIVSNTSGMVPKDDIVKKIMKKQGIRTIPEFFSVFIDVAGIENENDYCAVAIISYNMMLKKIEGVKQ